MNIEQLLEHYFEGRTTAEDEAYLRHFFTTGDVSEHLGIYKPLFVYIEKEINQSKDIMLGSQPDKTDKSINSLINGKKYMLLLSGLATCAAILAGIFFYITPQKRCPVSGNYVMIDGRCYTDAATIRSATMKVLHEIAEDDEFSSDEKSSSVFNMVENQLKEFNFLLDE